MITVEQYGIYDFRLTGDVAKNNPFFTPLKATFEHESGFRIENVPGFYDGHKTWVVRFSPTLLGIWRGRTTSSESFLDGHELPIVGCVPTANPAVRGRVRVDPSWPRRFVYENGMPLILLGFECDWLFAFHQADPHACREFIDLIAARGFNTIVTNVYAHTGFSEIGTPHVYGPPKHYVFGGTNENPVHAVMNRNFFRDFDALMSYLHTKGIVVHLMIQVQNKRVRWAPRRSAEDDLYWRYVVARYQAYSNLLWDVSKESFNLHRETGSHDYTLERLRLIREWDAYGHLVTVHDPVAGSPAAFSVVDDACDFVADQIHLGDVSLYNREALRRWRLRAKPYVNIEYGYEEGVEPIKTYRGGTTTSWQNVLLWTYAIYFGGGYPVYYYSNTAWDLIKYEPEPPGWRRYRYLIDFLARTDFNRLEPDNEFVNRGFCLAERGKQYVIFLPEGGNVQVDLTAVDSQMNVEWMRIYEGDKRTTSVEELTFTTRLSNPFGEEPTVLRLTSLPLTP